MRVTSWAYDPSITQGSIFIGLIVFTVFGVLGYRAEEKTGDPYYGGTVLIIGTVLAFATAAVLG
jgi:heme/copper-type cytochrome/quinol oxidase subunit 2